MRRRIPWDAADFLVLQPGPRAAATLGEELIVRDGPATDRAGEDEEVGT